MDYVIVPVLIMIAVAAYLVYRGYAGRLRTGGKPERE